MEYVFLMCVVVFGFVLIALGIAKGFEAGKYKGDRMTQLTRYWAVEIGMDEESMLDIMGYGYDRSYLKDGTTKYEWRVDGESWGYSYKGFSHRQYSGVKKVSIYTKDNKVIEIKPYNV